MSISRKSKPALARRTWQLMFDLLVRTSGGRSHILAKHGLTPNDSRALSSLERDNGRTMRSLAELWGCDASNATWIIERLVKLGLVERRALPGDRRVKLVALTRAGLQLRKELMREFHEPPEELLDLSQRDLEQLHSIAEKFAAKRSSRAGTSSTPKP